MVSGLHVGVCDWQTDGQTDKLWILPALTQNSPIMVSGLHVSVCDRQTDKFWILPALTQNTPIMASGLHVGVWDWQTDRQTSFEYYLRWHRIPPSWSRDYTSVTDRQALDITCVDTEFPYHGVGITRLWQTDKLWILPALTQNSPIMESGLHVGVCVSILPALTQNSPIMESGLHVCDRQTDRQTDKLCILPALTQNSPIMATGLHVAVCDWQTDRQTSFVYYLRWHRTPLSWRRDYTWASASVNSGSASHCSSMAPGPSAAIQTPSRFAGL